jgi:hypothetical protein
MKDRKVDRFYLLLLSANLLIVCALIGGCATGIWGR